MPLLSSAWVLELASNQLSPKGGHDATDEISRTTILHLGMDIVGLTGHVR